MCLSTTTLRLEPQSQCLTRCNRKTTRKLREIQCGGACLTTYTLPRDIVEHSLHNGEKKKTLQETETSIKSLLHRNTVTCFNLQDVLAQ